MFNEIKNGIVGLFAASREGAASCRGFVGGLGGDPESARAFDDVKTLIAAIEGGELDVVVIADDGCLFHPEGVPVFGVASDHDVPIATVFDVSLVEPSQATIAALLASEPSAWQPLLEALMKGHLGKAAPASFVEAASKKSSNVDVWTAALRAAIEQGRIESEHVRGLLEPKQRFADWFTNGLSTAEPDADVYWSRLRQLETHPSGDVCRRCRELRDELALLDFDDVHTRACLIYAARLLEEGAWDDAEAAAEEAIAVAERHGDTDTRAAACRVRVGARLGKLEIYRAFEELDAILASARGGKSEERALLDEIFGAPAGPAPVLATKRFFTDLDPLEEAKREVAFHVQAFDGEDDAHREPDEQHDVADDAAAEERPFDFFATPEEIERERRERRHAHVAGRDAERRRVDQRPDEWRDALERLARCLDAMDASKAALVRERARGGQTPCSEPRAVDDELARDDTPRGHG